MTVCENPDGHVDTYEQARGKLTQYFQPMRDTQIAIYKFRECVQNAGESVDHYATRLRILSKDCEFPAVDVELKMQILAKTNSKNLRRKMFKHPQWTLEDVLNEARSMEKAEVQATDIENPESSETTQKINTYKERNKKAKGNGYKGNGYKAPAQGPRPSQYTHAQGKSQGPTQKCKHCGRSWPHSGGMEKCPARGKTCHKCGRENHFSTVCRSTKSGANQNRHVHRVAVADTDDPEDESYVFHVQTRASSKLPHTTIKTMGHPVMYMIDSGSSVNIINTKTYRQLGKPPLEKAAMKILAYGSQKPLEVWGRFHTTLETNRGTAEANVMVVNTDSDNLLSYQTAKVLHLLEVHTDTVNALKTQPSSAMMESDRLIHEFPQMFEGVGKLKGYQAKVHIDDSVPPVAQPHRRIPFHLRERLAAEIQRLEDLDIIEKVEGPTPWVSPAVVVEKKSGDIRICVDMKQANKAVKRQRHPGPTVDDLITDLNGATVFSKIDMREGYHQIELEPGSRDITTFSTHVGLRRYKRLIMGISCASELFNQLIENVVEGIPGVRNRGDDIIIFGKGPNAQQDHDASLRQLCIRFVENNLTSRRNKCLFNQPAIT